jgi:hypothetical protein
MWFKRDECVHEFHSNDYLLLQWSGNTQTRFGLVGPIISAQQPFYYNSKLHFCLACVQVGVLQLNEIAAACVGCMMQIFD